MSEKLQRAKRLSLIKWNKVLKAYPDFDKMSDLSRGVCGFCKEYDSCGKCPLKPSICFDDDSLFERISYKIERSDKQGLKKMIQKMIREIEKAKDLKEGKKK